VSHNASANNDLAYTRALFKKELTCCCCYFARSFAVVVAAGPRQVIYDLNSLYINLHEIAGFSAKRAISPAGFCIIIARADFKRPVCFLPLRPLALRLWRLGSGVGVGT